MSEKKHYNQFRDNYWPCGCKNCKYWTADSEAQNCYGELKSGDPAVMECTKYVPEPHSYGVHRDSRVVGEAGIQAFSDLCNELKQLQQRIADLEAFLDPIINFLGYVCSEWPASEVARELGKRAKQLKGGDSDG